MAEDSGSTAVLGFVVGAIVVAVLVFVFFVVIPRESGPDVTDRDVDINIEAPPTPEAPQSPGPG
jgi:hypothetical protein